MSKARTLANLISDNAELADGQISVAEVVGAAPTANPTFTGRLTTNGAAQGDTYFTGGTANSRLLNVFTSTHDGATNAGHNFKIASGSGAFIFGNNTTANLLTVKSGGIDVTGAGTFSSNVSLTGTLNVDSSTTNGFLSAGSNILNFGTTSNDTLAFYANNTNHMKLKPDGEVILNETGNAEGDLRVESDSNSHMLFVDAGNNRVSIGNSNTYSMFNVVSSNDNTSDWWTNSVATQYMQNTVGHTVLKMNNNNSNRSAYLVYNGNGSAQGFHIFDRQNEQSRISAYTSSVVVNEAGADVDFRVESDGSQYAFFVDGGTNNIGIQSGTSWSLSGGGSASSGSGVSIDMSYDGTIYAGSSYWAGGLKTGTGFFSDASGDRYKRSSRQVTQISQNSQGGDIKFRSQTSGTAGAVISWHEMADFGRNEVVFNDGSADQDFRVESDGNTHALFVEAGTNTVGILQPNPNNWSNSANQLVIGTTSGSNGLTVVSGTGNSGNVFFSDGTTGNQQYRGYIQYDHNNDRLNLGAGAADHVRVEGSQTVVNEDSNIHDFRVESNNVANMLFVDASEDKIGIGTSNPDSMLHLSGSNEQARIKFQVGTASADKFKIYGSTAGRLYVNSDATNTGVYLTYNGTSWTSNSDETLKENITSLGTVGDKLKNYRTSYFNWKADTDTPPKRNIGFIAQDWENDFPEVVTKKEGESLGMQYTETIPILLKYIQELEARITALENA